VIKINFKFNATQKKTEAITNEAKTIFEAYRPTLFKLIHRHYDGILVRNTNNQSYL
jgi:hypothetical protein